MDGLVDLNKEQRAILINYLLITENAFADFLKSDESIKIPFLILGMVANVFFYLTDKTIIEKKKESYLDMAVALNDFINTGINAKFFEDEK